MLDRCLAREAYRLAFVPVAVLALDRELAIYHRDHAEFELFAALVGLPLLLTTVDLAGWLVSVAAVLSLEGYSLCRIRLSFFRQKLRINFLFVVIGKSKIVYSINLGLPVKSRKFDGNLI